MFMQNLEKRMFKKTPAGYIFQFPPSRFRRTDAVLVTAPQKEEISRHHAKELAGRAVPPAVGCGRDGHSGGSHGRRHIGPADVRQCLVRVQCGFRDADRRH